MSNSGASAGAWARITWPTIFPTSGKWSISAPAASVRRFLEDEMSDDYYYSGQYAEG